MYVMRRKKRPANLNRANHDRLNHWCQDWEHQNFQIYTVPGEQNLFNDFHSRGGAPDAAPFQTLEQHEQRLQRKLDGLEEQAALSTDQLDARLAAAVPLEGAPGPAGRGSASDPKVVRQHLVLPRQEPASTEDLDQWDRNLAGKSLLPEVQPFDWPKPAEFAEAQTQLAPELARVLRRVDSSEPGVSLLLDSDGKIVLPQGAEALKARICAVTHQGRHGHLPHEVSCRLIQKYFWWSGLKHDVRDWMGRCLQCIKLKGGKLMPRPMGHMLTAQRPFEVVAMDYLDMPATGRNGYKHVLVIVDQLTRVCVCAPTKDKTAQTAARIFCDRWLSFFPSPTFLITDGGTHFRCELFRSITSIRGFEHHITAPHSQWSNGRVERLNCV